MVGKAENKAENKAVIEKAIRRNYNKPTGELTKADLEEVESLNLSYNQLTDFKGLEKLVKLEKLWLGGNPDLTKAQIDELQKALPECTIYVGRMAYRDFP